jgi:hypothetical protein
MQGFRSLLQACAVRPCACAAGWLDAQPLTSDGPRHRRAEQGNQGGRR